MIKLRPFSRISFRDPSTWAHDLPGGHEPLSSGYLPVEGWEPGVKDAMVIICGSSESEDPEEVAVYVEGYDADGFTVGTWTRYVRSVREAERLVGFLESPLDASTLSLLSFTWEGW